MDWLTKLEKKYGKYAIPNLMRYIVALYAAGFILNYINPNFYDQYLAMNPAAILHGQVWRIVSFLMYPPSDSILFIIFALILYYFIGQALEAVWGAFRFNVYFFSGVIFHVLAALIVYLFFGINLALDTTYLNLSLFFVFAFLFPDVQFLLYFIIPVKVKWLAILDGVFFVWTIIRAFLPPFAGSAYAIYYYALALEAFVSILNFLIFALTTKGKQVKQKARKQNFERKVKQERPKMQYANGARHRCAVCGKTELDDPNLEFRYCSKCNGNYEYCQEHLFTHQHIQ